MASPAPIRLDVRLHGGPAIGYPLFPAIALGLAVMCLVTMVYFNPLVSGLFVGFLVVAYGYFRMTAGRRAAVTAAEGSAVIA